MVIYELNDQGIRPVNETSFSREGIQERADLQRFLRDQIDIIAPETLLIAEEFGQWEDARRRIDLLAIDKDANLVVIELKRTDDGGHMELQAIRYAAMVSAMTFERAVAIFGEYLKGHGREEDPEATLLDFLDWDTPSEDEFAQDVRIVLAASDFSKEISTAVIWLNQRGLDIRCVRLKPYRDGNRILLDVQQVLPLPEASDYQVQIREKQEKERNARRQQRDYTRYTVTAGTEMHEHLPKRWAIYHVVKYLCSQGISPEEITDVVPWRKNMFRKVEGRVGAETFASALMREQEQGGRAFDPRRYFCNEEELIHTGGCTYALTNQWGNRTEEALTRFVEAFRDKGVAYKESERSS